MVDSPIQLQILSNCCFYESGSRYSQLKPNDIDDDLFNYHLQQLVKKGYLEKRDRLYFLSEKGKSLATNIDYETHKIPLNYKVSVYLCPVINNEVLLYERLKHPQYGYTGLISGKIRYGEPVLSAARREFIEETGLTADFKIIGNLRQIRRNEDGKVIEDGVFYVCFTDQIKGNLTEKNIEGKYFWAKLHEASKLEKIFKPSLEVILNEVKNRLDTKVSWDADFIYEFEPEPEDY
ncbi:NUDIX domain-containing protein [Patescibacteria group bacterium]|nr:NUDIX domain-containing protein [Patescibacteria group bacterium]